MALAAQIAPRPQVLPPTGSADRAGRAGQSSPLGTGKVLAACFAGRLGWLLAGRGVGRKVEVAKRSTAM